MEDSEGWRDKSLPRPYPQPRPNLHPPVEVAVDSYVVGGTTLAFCGDTKKVRQPYRSNTGWGKTIKG